MKASILIALLVPGLLLALPATAQPEEVTGPTLRCAKHSEGPAVNHRTSVVFEIDPSNATEPWYSEVQMKPNGTAWSDTDAVTIIAGPTSTSTDLFGAFIDALKCNSKVQIRVRTYKLAEDGTRVDETDFSKSRTCGTDPCLCTDANDDWRCKACRDAALQLNTTKGALASCYLCADKATALDVPVSGCVSCMSAPFVSIIKGCHECIARGTPGWSCSKYCAAYARNREQMDVCTECLAARNAAGQDLWGCENCMKLAANKTSRIKMCAKCVTPTIVGNATVTLDAWQCGQCLNTTAPATCYDCLAANPKKGQNDKCLKP